MKMNILLLILLLSICYLIGCDSQLKKLTKVEMLEIVDSNNLLLKKYFENADLEKLAEMYTDSAKLCPNGYNFVYGRDSIKAFWKEDFENSKVLDMKTTTTSVEGNIEIIYETGKTTSKISYMDSIYTPTVKYINIWVKQKNGKYLLDVDFWNNDLSKK